MESFEVSFEGYREESFSKQKWKTDWRLIILEMCLSGTLESLGTTLSTTKTCHGCAQWRHEVLEFKVILSYIVSAGVGGRQQRQLQRNHTRPNSSTRSLLRRERAKVMMVEREEGRWVLLLCIYTDG